MASPSEGVQREPRGNHLLGVAYKVHNPEPRVVHPPLGPQRGGIANANHLCSAVAAPAAVQPIHVCASNAGSSRAICHAVGASYCSEGGRLCIEGASIAMQ